MSDEQSGKSQEKSGNVPTPPRLKWGFGTAYDFFVSLVVLHDPDTYGLRASWAAGVRSRLPARERKFLEEVLPFIWVPLYWIYALPEPKDAVTALWALRQLPSDQRLLALASSPSRDQGIGAIVRSVAERRAWDQEDREALQAIYHAHDKHHGPKDLTTLLDWWSRPDEFGELLLSGLQSYHDAFFAEEEKRIAPALQKGLEQAKELAQERSLPDLLADLSQGVHFDEPFDAAELVLVPAYWSTPLVLWDKIEPERMLFLFGVRPANASVVPGELVPDGLLRSLKALADPTRLRILRYLSEEPLTPAELSRRLRLRAPTVTHHLSALRLAGLVHLILQAEGERRYAARLEAIESTFANLQDYLKE